MSKKQQIEELKDLLDRMIGNSSRLQAEILYAHGYRRQCKRKRKCCPNCVAKTKEV